MSILFNLTDYSDMYYNTTYGEDNITEPYNVTFIYGNEDYHCIELVSMVLYSITVIIGIPGNATVIWVAGLKMKRTVNTVWFVNLAIADFLCCLSLPFSIAHLAMHYHWPFGQVLCQMVSSAMVFNMFASVFLLTVISIDRCVLVTNPIWSQNNRKPHLAVIVCATIWLLAFLMSLPVFLYREVHTDSFSDQSICTYTSDYVYVSRLRILLKFVFGFLLPFFIICICYGSITNKVRSSRFTRSRKTFKVVVIVIVAFFICWSPYHIIEILSIFLHPGDTESNIHDWLQVLDSLTIGLAYMNSCVNPMVYVFTGQEFKEKVRKSVKQVFESAFSEELTRTTAQSKSKTRSSMDDGIAQSIM
ncbi:C3a anaphylatoxin chemotactic receptor-like [Protopterus annectens]|uniref:C3a anaphylatoxin chemotactic receptor-like n=1 Tax=Protopterus annectens TaxID=7888 RepID=UPI001CFB22EC|nr:C3a anaphylatoxin chemotactic receptor-like [Protopterus annectens]XP_043919799.1 C3a anaphylatoxin chemotactic receptor-like [Protopterus annectens]